MPGRRLLDEDLHAGHGDNPYHRQRTRRQQVLRETVARFEQARPRDRYHQLARENLDLWRSNRRAENAAPGTVQVFPGDWGEVTQALTRQHGACFAVLNMANAHVPGGAYVEGAAAQEENMFRRTDCHFSIDADSYDAASDLYHPEWTALIAGETGRVLLDTANPRVCLRGPEDISREDLGYPWLAEDDIFPFYELRSAAVNIRHSSAFAPQRMRKRIAAQLDTLAHKAVKHVVFGAFGCGAFGNPAREVAKLYRDEISRRREHFSVIAFAIFHPGYGPGNYAPFSEVFDHGLVLG